MYTSHFTVQGTHCASCKMLIEMTLQNLPGVTSAALDLQTGQGQVISEEPLAQEDIKKEIEELGNYIVEFPETTTQD